MSGNCFAKSLSLKSVVGNSDFPCFQRYSTCFKADDVAEKIRNICIISIFYSKICWWVGLDVVRWLVLKKWLKRPCIGKNFKLSPTLSLNCHWFRCRFTLTTNVEYIKCWQLRCTLLSRYTNANAGYSVLNLR